jgi:hypothetical protein
MRVHNFYCSLEDNWTDLNLDLQALESELSNTYRTLEIAKNWERREKSGAGACGDAVPA